MQHAKQSLPKFFFSVSSNECMMSLFVTSSQQKYDGLTLLYIRDGHLFISVAGE